MGFLLICEPAVEHREGRYQKDRLRSCRLRSGTKSGPRLIGRRDPALEMIGYTSKRNPTETVAIPIGTGEIRERPMECFVPMQPGFASPRWRIGMLAEPGHRRLFAMPRIAFFPRPYGIETGESRLDSLRYRNPEFPYLQLPVEANSYMRL